MKNILFVLMLGIFMISSISGAISNLGTFKQGDSMQLIQTCDDCTYNNISNVLFPNGSILLGQVAMDREDTFYNYTFENTTTIGKYKVNGYGNPSGAKTTWNYEFEVTPSGKSITGGSSGIIIIGVIFFFVLGAICFIGFFKQKGKVAVKWTYFLFGFMMFLASLNLISAIIPDVFINENIVNFFDSFTAISFIMFWFAFGLLAVMWILTIFQTVFYRNLLNKANKYG